MVTRKKKGEWCEEMRNVGRMEMQSKKEKVGEKGRESVDGVREECEEERRERENIEKNVGRCKERRNITEKKLVF